MDYYITYSNLVCDVIQFSKEERIKNSFMSVNLHNGRPHSTADLKHETLYATETCKRTVATKTIAGVAEGIHNRQGGHSHN